MKYSASKEIDAHVRELVRGGWTFRRGGKHGRLISPNGKAQVVVPSTPGDRRSPLNFRSDVRRASA